MAIALVANTTLVGSTGNTWTSPAIDTTGANLIVIGASAYQGNGSPTVSDSKGNTWTALTARPAVSVAFSRLFYCLNPTVGSGHTFTTDGKAGVIAVAAFSGVATSSAFDQQTGAATGNGASSVQPGSITPSAANALFVTTFCTADNSSGTDSIGSSFIITDQLPFVSGKYEGVALAYKISSSAENPTWSVAVAGWFEVSAAMATFLAATGGGSAKLFRKSNLDGIGSGGPFFSNPLAA